MAILGVPSKGAHMTDPSPYQTSNQEREARRGALPRLLWIVGAVVVLVAVVILLVAVVGGGHSPQFNH
jgi:hypothetical protein